MAQIKLPLAFFRKERDTGYSDWRSAFWRELLSNSLDAGATAIAITLAEYSDGQTVLHFEDNGKGMSREVCENIYLSIGLSTKDGDKASVGGFGRARILTCFSMKAYQIIGDGYTVSGEGAEYSIAESPAREAGLIVSIWPDMRVPWKTYLERVLSQCDLPGLFITFNGMRLYPDPLRPKDNQFHEIAGNITNATGEHCFGRAGLVEERQLSIRNLHANRVYFRVNGMVMFEQYTYQVKDKALLLEINPAIARDVLTANRDGLKPEANKLVNEILKKIQDEGSAALSKKARRENLFCGNIADLRMMNEGHPADTFNPIAVAPDPFNRPADSDDQPIRGVQFSPRGYFATPMMFSILTEDETLTAVADSWTPGNETPAMRRIMRAWSQACEIALQTFVRCKPHQNYLWLPGLVFRDDVIAEAQRMDGPEGCIYAFNLNPIGPSKANLAGDNYGQRFNPALKADRQCLLASALHEVAHVHEKSHDVDFAEILTQLIEEVDMQLFLKLSKGW